MKNYLNAKMILFTKLLSEKKYIITDDRLNVFSKIKKIRKQEILVFALIFSLFIAFMAGFTSVLFGVLVRIRAPLMPFIFLVLTTNVFENKQLEKEKE